jgi:hypothetical protein
MPVEKIKLMKKQRSKRVGLTENLTHVAKAGIKSGCKKSFGGVRKYKMNAWILLFLPAPLLSLHFFYPFMSFGRSTSIMMRRLPALSLGRRPFSPVRLTTSPSNFYHSDESNKHNANGNNFAHTTNDTNSNSNKDVKANSQDSNTQWNLTSSDKGKSYQDTISAVQALSRSQMEKLQRDIQPLIHRVQDATNTLKRLTHDVTDSKDALKRASMALNELTGYNQIELVKKKVTEQGNKEQNYPL